MTLAVSGLIWLGVNPTSALAQTTNFTGSHKCGSYHTGDTRSQPPSTDLTNIVLDTISTGYVLELVFNDERGDHSIPLSSDLHLSTDRQIPYTPAPMEISPDGQFSITIFGRSSICTFSGTSQISEAAFSRLFGDGSSQLSLESKSIEWLDIQTPNGSASVGTNTINRQGDQITFDAIAEYYVRYNGNCQTEMLYVLKTGSLDANLQPTNIREGFGTVGWFPASSYQSSMLRQACSLS